MSNEAYFSPLTVPVVTETAHERATMTAARSRGYAAGFAEGRRVAALEQQRWRAAAEEARAAEAEESARRVAELVTALSSAGVALREATVPELAEAQDTLVQSAFELAAAVVGVALEDRVAAARAAVARVVSAAAPGATPVVRLHPDDLAALRVSGEPLDGLDVRADASLDRGDAIAQVQDGWLDGRIRAALERAKEALA